MWKLYTRNYLRGNRTTSRSLGVTLLIFFFFISLMLCLFWNLWADERARAVWEGRAWQPTVLTWLYAMIFFLVCLALMSMIYHAFEMTREGRMHQIGILQSVGATPRQVHLALMEEAFVLGIPAMLIGIAVGTGSVRLFLRWANRFNHAAGNMEAVFQYPLWLFLLTAGVCIFLLWLAASRAARQLSRMTALEALRGNDENIICKPRRFRLFSIWIGVEWELAKRSLRGRKKAFRTASLSLTLAFLAFSLFLNLWAMSSASRQHTYFERYESVWSAGQYAAEMEKEQMAERGYTLFVGGLCTLLAGIGIANVFANTLGSVRQRRREFARYQSLGFTRESMWKMLAAEGAVTVLRPFAFCLPPNLLFVIWGVRRAQLTWQDYLRVIPAVPFCLFVGVAAAFTALAVFLSGRKILNGNLAEALKDDTLR